MSVMNVATIVFSFAAGLGFLYLFLSKGRKKPPAAKNAPPDDEFGIFDTSPRTFVPRIMSVPLGFNSEKEVPAGGTWKVTSCPQVPFKGKRLMIPADIASKFVILDIKIGTQSIFSSSDSISARFFVESAPLPFNVPTAYPAMQVTIDVQNVSGAPEKFSAMMVGDSIQDL